MEQSNTFEMLIKIAKAQSERFPAGNDPFKIGCRILEEGGEVAWELNHYERKEISLERGNSKGKEHIALEAFQLCEVTMQLLQYFNLIDEFEHVVAGNYSDYAEKGYIKTEK